MKKKKYKLNTLSKCEKKKIMGKIECKIIFFKKKKQFKRDEMKKNYNNTTQMQSLFCNFTNENMIDTQHSVMRVKTKQKSNKKKRKINNNFLKIINDLI